jgi:hypothetical protein
MKTLPATARPPEMALPADENRPPGGSSRDCVAAGAPRVFLEHGRGPMRGFRLLAPRAEDQADLEALAIKITEEHALAQGAMRASVAHAVRTGELLIEAKRRVGHGGFQIFVQRYCKLAPRTAQAYMRLARELPKLPTAKAQRVADLSLRDAISAVATDIRNIAALPPPAAEQALKEAKLDRLRNAVSRQQTAERIRARPAEPQVYETVLVGQVGPPPEFASHEWPAWRLCLRYSLMTSLLSSLRLNPEITANDACETLNDVYVWLQENGLQALDDAVAELQQALDSALRREANKTFEHARAPGDPQMLEAIAQKQTRSREQSEARAGVGDPEDGDVDGKTPRRAPGAGRTTL